jgi:hypothetical protein
MQPVREAMTSTGRRVAALAVLAGLCAGSLVAATPLSRRWNELEKLITNEKVVLQLASGTAGGRVVAFGQDEIALERGGVRQHIRAAEVTSIRFTRYRGRGGRAGALTGFVFGTIAGVVVFLYVGLDETSGDTPAVRKAKTIAAWLGTWAGSTVTGYLLGRWIDRETVEVTVIH